MLTRPVLATISIINANIENTIDFTVRGGEQIGGHIMEIYDNSNGSLVTTIRKQSFISEVVIPAKLLFNGREYRVRLKTVNTMVNSDFSNVSSENSSDWSDYAIIRCFTPAEVKITNIPMDSDGIGLIKNQTFTFIATYKQEENAMLKSYRYILYDYNRVILESFDSVYQTDPVMTHTIQGFKNSTEYFIEVKTLDQFDVESSSGLVKFRVDYLPPKIQQVFKVENDSVNALVKAQAQIIQVLLKAEGVYSFIEDEEINLTVDGARAYIDNALDLADNFSMQVWCREVTEGKPFLMVKDVNNREMSFVLRNKRIHGYQKFNTVVRHIATPKLANYVEGGYMTVFITHKDNELTIIGEMIAEVNG